MLASAKLHLFEWQLQLWNLHGLCSHSNTSVGLLLPSLLLPSLLLGASTQRSVVCFLVESVANLKKKIGWSSSSQQFVVQTKVCIVVIYTSHTYTDCARAMGTRDLSCQRLVILQQEVLPPGLPPAGLRHTQTIQTAKHKSGYLWRALQISGLESAVNRCEQASVREQAFLVKYCVWASGNHGQALLVLQGKGKGKVSKLYPPNEGSLAGCGLQRGSNPEPTGCEGG